MSTAPAQRYTASAIALHWILAVLIVANLGLGFYTVDLALSPRKLKLFSWHKWVGVTVFILAGARLLWRLRHEPPPLPAAMKAWEARAAHLSHGLLYALFFAVPLTGWLFSSAAGFQTVYLGVLPIPDLLGKDKELAEILKLVHHGAAYALTAIVVVHAAAAIKHHLIDRDDVLVRMLPFLRQRSP